MEEKECTIHYVTGGPGCGKTEALANFAVDWLKKNPSQSRLLCLTFTRNATEEMSKRIWKLQSEEEIDMNFECRDIHSFALSVLTDKYGDTYFLDPGYSQKSLDSILQKKKKKIKKINDTERLLIQKLTIAYNIFWHHNLLDESPDNDFGIRVKPWKDIDEIKDQYLHSFLQNLKREYGTYCGGNKKRAGKPLPLDMIAFTLFHDKILDKKIIDHNDCLIMAYLSVLDPDCDILKKRSYDWIAVDEFQDNSTLLREFITKFKTEENTITFFGDPDQEIYSSMDWTRGTTGVKINKELDKELTQNGRSVKQIVEFINGYQKNVFLQPEKVFESKNEKSKEEALTFVNSKDQKNQNKYICDIVRKEWEKRQKDGNNLSYSTAILFRTNRDVDMFYNYYKFYKLSNNCPVGTMFLPLEKPFRSDSLAPIISLLKIAGGVHNSEVMKGLLSDVLFDPTNAPSEHLRHIKWASLKRYCQNGGFTRKLAKLNISPEFFVSKNANKSYLLDFLGELSTVLRPAAEKYRKNPDEYPEGVRLTINFLKKTYHPEEEAYKYNFHYIYIYVKVDQDGFIRIGNCTTPEPYEGCLYLTDYGLEGISINDLETPPGEIIFANFSEESSYFEWRQRLNTNISESERKHFWDLERLLSEVLDPESLDFTDPLSRLFKELLFGVKNDYHIKISFGPLYKSIKSKLEKTETENPAENENSSEDAEQKDKTEECIENWDEIKPPSSDTPIKSFIPNGIYQFPLVEKDQDILTLCRERYSRPYEWISTQMDNSIATENSDEFIDNVLSPLLEEFSKGTDMEILHDSIIAWAKKTLKELVAFHNVEFEKWDYHYNKVMKYFAQQLLDLRYIDLGLPSVTPMTVHKSKGLAFDHVIIADATENTYNVKTSDSEEPDLERDRQIEEEKRIMYVAATRARNKVAFVYYNNTSKNKKTELSSLLSWYRDLTVVSPKSGNSNEQGKE